MSAQRPARLARAMRAAARMDIHTILAHARPALIAIALVSSGVPAVVEAAPQRPTAATQVAPQLPLPPRTTLVGSTSVGEVRELPEEVQTRGRERAVEEEKGGRAVDRLYQTGTSYAGTVAFFDRTLPNRAFAVERQTTATTATVWSLERADGSPARLAVRNTSPTTIEWVAAKAAERLVR